MNLTAIYDNVKILNLEEKSSQDNSIHWYEAVTMQGTNINTVVVDKAVAPALEVGQDYSLILAVTEQLKVSGDRAYKAHKFKIVDYIPYSEND